VKRTFERISLTLVFVVLAFVSTPLIRAQPAQLGRTADVNGVQLYYEISGKGSLTCPPQTDPIRILEIGSKEGSMKGKKYSAEQIVTKLREAEVMLTKGQTLGDVCRQLEITDVTYYRWRKEYGGLRVDQAKQLKAIEVENTRLRKVIADLTIDNAILKEAS
jgi:putative transposase